MILYIILLLLICSLVFSMAYERGQDSTKHKTKPNNPSWWYPAKGGYQDTRHLDSGHTILRTYPREVEYDLSSEYWYHNIPFVVTVCDDTASLWTRAKYQTMHRLLGQVKLKESIIQEQIAFIDKVMRAQCEAADFAKEAFKTYDEIQQEVE